MEYAEVISNLGSMFSMFLGAICALVFVWGCGRG
jgi:hypothetical protein